MKYWMLLSLVLMAGCVSIGIECKTEHVNAWAKKRSVGFGVSKRQAENFAMFREKVCP